MPWSDAENAEYFGQPQEDYRERDVPARSLLERLREAEADYTVTWGSGDLYGEAAEELERMTEQIKRLNKEADALAACVAARTEPRLTRDAIRDLATQAGWREQPTVRLAYAGFRLDEFAEAVYAAARGLGPNSEI